MLFSFFFFLFFFFTYVNLTLLISQFIIDVRCIPQWHTSFFYRYYLCCTVINVPTQSNLTFHLSLYRLYCLTRTGYKYFRKSKRILGVFNYSELQGKRISNFPPLRDVSFDSNDRLRN